MVAGKTKPSRPSGAEAEDLACAWLQARGLRLRERNYRSRRGEIDLIMQDGDQLVFVEVRYRNSSRYGSAAESVTAAKQTRLISAASQYLQGQRHTQACRFDVLAISADREAMIIYIC